jgi:major membrane immunogen (membrane-anchored lipoprotein)
MRKLSYLLVMVAVLLTGLSACGGTAAGYKPGTYSAEDAAFDDSGYKASVTVDVGSDGKITAVNWDGIPEAGGPTKKEMGDDYGMRSASGIGKEWYEQVAVMESELIKTQDPAKIPVTADGYADGVSGCTIHVNGFVKLASEALEQAK